MPIRSLTMPLTALAVACSLGLAYAQSATPAVPDGTTTTPAGGAIITPATPRGAPAEGAAAADNAMRQPQADRH